MCHLRRNKELMDTEKSLVITRAAGGMGKMGERDKQTSSYKINVMENEMYSMVTTVNNTVLYI